MDVAGKHLFSANRFANDQHWGIMAGQTAWAWSRSDCMVRLRPTRFSYGMGVAPGTAAFVSELGGFERPFDGEQQLTSNATRLPTCG